MSSNFGEIFLNGGEIFELQAIFSNLNWTYLLIPLNCMGNQQQSGQVQLRLETQINFFWCVTILTSHFNQPKLV
jgi:hypothetical protein